ncbi:MAG: Hsp20/alpha crystallin family protein [Bacteroidetes bacterium]|nr:Hsp20/alpha crystallin family protein [Bacteroidota bacterium]MBS1757501.1 Hsp20/alpha crystallin family protein [Bacteroidota bacterium]
MTLVKVNNGFSKSLDGMMKDLFTEFPSAVSKTFREDVLHFPPVNIVDKEAAYTIEMAVPGFEKSDFNVKLENNILTISTEKKETKTETTEKIVRQEFSKKSFKRSFTIDEKIDAENILAKYENGMLLLELPKKEIIKAGAKEINIQ